MEEVAVEMEMEMAMMDHERAIQRYHQMLDHLLELLTMRSHQLLSLQPTTTINQCPSFDFPMLTNGSKTDCDFVSQN
jgi:hypothetical protein